MALVMPPVDPTVLARRGAIVAALELFFRPIASWRTRWGDGHTSAMRGRCIANFPWWS